MAVMSSLGRAREVLREVFGFEDFLDGQEVVIGDILSGQDGSVVMPTGGVVSHSVTNCQRFVGKG